MNKIKGILISTLLLLSILTIIAPVSAGTIHVYPGDNIATKLNNAVSGDTVYVHAGTYPLTSDVMLQNKSLTIIGDGASTTIITSTTNYIYVYTSILTTSMNFSISGITFKNASTNTYMLNIANGWPSKSFKAYVSDCVFDDGQFGIYLPSAGLNVFETSIKNCEFKNLDNPIYGVGESTVFTVHNCLFFDNVNAILTLSSYPTITSCTIDKNSNIGIMLNSSAPATIRDCIITNKGIGITSVGFGTVTATYNNVWNNTLNYSSVTAGAGSISQDPSYATGRLGKYYLSQSSPSVDKGSASAASLGLDKMTTRTDERWDAGTVDMGYHYVSNWLGKRGLPIAKILEILKLNKNK